MRLLDCVNYWGLMNSKRFAKKCQVVLSPAALFVLLFGCGGKTKFSSNHKPVAAPLAPQKENAAAVAITPQQPQATVEPPVPAVTWAPTPQPTSSPEPESFVENDGIKFGGPQLSGDNALGGQQKGFGDLVVVTPTPSGNGDVVTTPLASPSPDCTNAAAEPGSVAKIIFIGQMTANASKTYQINPDASGNKFETMEAAGPASGLNDPGPIKPDPTASDIGERTLLFRSEARGTCNAPQHDHGAWKHLFFLGGGLSYPTLTFDSRAITNNEWTTTRSYSQGCPNWGSHSYSDPFKVKTLTFTNYSNTNFHICLYKNNGPRSADTVVSCFNPAKHKLSNGSAGYEISQTQLESMARDGKAPISMEIDWEGKMCSKGAYIDLGK